MLFAAAGVALTLPFKNIASPTTCLSDSLPVIVTVDLPMDGTEVSTMTAGKPTGQTMSAKRLDDRHYTGVVKQNGQLSLTNNATLSADGKTLTVEDKVAGGQTVTETWVKK